jgi:hypothetical protein
VKLIGVSKKIHLLDVVASSQARAVGVVVTHTARVSTLDNLSDDSSLDVHKTSSPARMTEKRVSPPPLVSGEFFYFSFMIFTVGPNN